MIACPSCGSEDIELDLHDVGYYKEKGEVEIGAKCNKCNADFETAWKFVAVVVHKRR